MTETEWLAGADPTPMLWSLKGKASKRKLRLFGCACCRRVWHLLTFDERCRDAVAVAERFADGKVDNAALSKARTVAGRAKYPKLNDPVFKSAGYDLHLAINEIARLNPAFRPGVVSSFLANAVAKTGGDRNQESEAQAHLLRDIVGNPFRPVTLDRSWLTRDVRALAKGIYKDRAFDQMPILADALQDAGCDSEDVLNHCRGPGPHVRGCWVVDLVLGRG